MNRERVVFFVDFANIDKAARDQGVELDYGALAEYMSEGRFLVESHAFVPIDPRNEHRRDRLIDRLWESGYVVHRKVGTRAGESYKCDFDVEITMEVLRTVYSVRPDIIVLATGDSDFIPLVHEVRRNGVRLEVASFECALSKHLRLRASGFISLDLYAQEVLAADRQIPDEDDVVVEDAEGPPVDINRPDLEATSAGPSVPHADDF